MKVVLFINTNNCKLVWKCCSFSNFLHVYLNDIQVFFLFETFLMHPEFEMVTYQSFRAVSEGKARLPTYD